MTFELTPELVTWIVAGISLIAGTFLTPLLARLGIRLPVQPATPSDSSKPANPATPAAPNDHPILRTIARSLLSILGIQLPTLRIGSSMQANAAVATDQEDKAMIAMGRIVHRELKAMDDEEKAPAKS